MNDLDQQLRPLIPRLRRFALSLTRQPSSADDLVQACLEPVSYTHLRAHET